jgi:DNA-binding NtrC family response regulator
VIASTNKVLEEALQRGELREDLFYRLNVFRIDLPPLRQREGDIPVLVESLIDLMNKKHGCKVTEATSDTLDLLQRHSWPGNVRELRNVIERAVIIAGEGPVTPQHLAPNFGTAPGTRPATPVSEPDVVRLPVGTTVGEAEKALIMVTLKHTKNNKTRAAEILGISLKTLFNKLKEYGSQEPVEA